MKFFASQLLTYFNIPGRRNARLLLRFALFMLVLIALFSWLFMELMEREGRPRPSTVTAVYWTLTVMSTLGFGDITFHSDLGRLFSMVVLSTGTLTLLVLLPFMFIQFVYQPWMQAQDRSRAPRSLPPDTSGHVILTNYGNISNALIQKLKSYGYSYVLIVPELEEALQLNDQGLAVMVGALGDPDTWRRARVEQAALVATTKTDAINTNVAFTVRAVAPDVRIIATASDPASVDILHLAGCTSVLRLGLSMGRMMARRIVRADSIAHIIGNFNELMIAEASVRGTPLVGRRLGDIDRDELGGLVITGTWHEGRFQPAGEADVLTDKSVLFMMGDRHQIQVYNRAMGETTCDDPVLIIGGGRVGRSAARYLKGRDIPYKIIEKLAERIRDPEHYILGSAAEIEVMRRAGIERAPAVLITTRDDDINVYLTIYCRSLRPDIQILSRCVFEPNVATLHRAGADYVLSYATMGANRLFNQIHATKEQVLEDGKGFFSLPVPEGLRGRSLGRNELWEQTGCIVIATRNEDGLHVPHDPEVALPDSGELVLFGPEEAAEKFLNRFVRNDS